MMTSITRRIGKQILLLIVSLQFVGCGKSDPKVETNETLAASSNALKVKNFELIQEIQDSKKVTVNVRYMNAESVHEVLKFLAKPETSINEEIKVIRLGTETRWSQVDGKMHIDYNLPVDDIQFALNHLETPRTFEMRNALEEALAQARKVRPYLKILVKYDQVEDEAGARKILDLLGSSSTPVHDYIKAIEIGSSSYAYKGTLGIDAGEADISYTLKNYQTPSMAEMRTRMRAILAKIRERRKIDISVNLEELPNSISMRLIERLESEDFEVHSAVSQIVIGAHNDVRILGNGKLQIKVNAYMLESDVLFLLKNLETQSALELRSRLTPLVNQVQEKLGSSIQLYVNYSAVKEGDLKRVLQRLLDSNLMFYSPQVKQIHLSDIEKGVTSDGEIWLDVSHS